GGDKSPGLIKITRAGWIYIALTILLGVSAINTGNNLVYLIVSAMLGFMGISGFFGRRNIERVELSLSLPSEIYANRPFPLYVTVRNRKGIFPAFLIRVRVEGMEVLFPFIEKKGEEVRSVQVTCRQRGWHRPGALFISSVFPFNFFTRYRRLDMVEEAIVFPEPKKCDLSAVSGKERELKGEKVTGRQGSEADIHSIREYIQGDSFRHIHWKAFAKTGELKTRELSALSRQPVVIEMENLPIRDLELKVSCVTYTVLTLLRSGVAVGLSFDGKRIMPDITEAHRLRLLRELALYGTE
ncbi:MAG: DUF58 domain-containing protein, partial [Nitrospirales bacterium]|nr:DUF58 domain-containing protein [Nitrospirales bacterium]